MKWTKYTLTTTTEAVDLVSDLFSEIGICGIEIEDNVPLSEADTKGMFIDILPELPPDDGTAKVSFYLDDTYDEEDIVRQVKEGLEEMKAYLNLGSCELVRSETEDKDWINNWKEFFHPFTVDDILIKPTWETIPEEDRDKLLIQIDPGTAFGTGQHETTQLCIRAIRKYLKKGDRVLDLGTGSGILSVVALKLGASYACGTDLDDNAINAVYENMEANDICPSLYKVICGNIIDDAAVQEQTGRDYDIVVANILADVIIPISGMVAPFVKKGGIFITSGIIDMKEQAVLAAMKANPELEIIDETRQGEWVSIVARRKQEI